MRRLEKPRFRNLEAELVIQRLRRRGEQAFRLREQADDAAFVERTRDLALHARAINFQQQREQIFHRHQAEQHAQAARDPEIRLRGNFASTPAMPSAVSAQT